MEDKPLLATIVSLLLIVGSFFFVASEYALVGSRRTRLESAAKKGDKRSRRALKALDHLGRLVAATQVGITMVGIGLGSVTEPFVTGQLTRMGGGVVPHSVSLVVSYLLITYLVVVLGELLPKYLVLQKPEAIARFTAAPISVVAQLLAPIVWIAQVSANLLLKMMGVRTGAKEETFEKDELLMLVKAGQRGGELESEHAEFITRALRLDALTARDVMIHRLDMLWLDVATPRDQLLNKLAEIPHSRIPVCREDIDDLVGVVYMNDIVKAYAKGDVNLEAILRPAVAVPENLALDRLVSTMRSERTQILIVMDEYGGTSGLITLEDVVEEVFGELEDKLESDRPPVEVHPGGRVTARADVRFDELVGRLGLELPDEPSTDTMAEMIVNAIERVPKIGDVVETPIGRLRVDNMARRRITRVSLRLKADLIHIQRGS